MLRVSAGPWVFVMAPPLSTLQVKQPDDGSGKPRQIVCGAKNFNPGDKVPLALPGTVLPGGFAIASRMAAASA